MKKYKTFKIIPAGTEKFPEMVQVVKETKRINVNKRFINETKAILWIDELKGVQLIQKGEESAKEQLKALALI